MFSGVPDQFLIWVFQFLVGCIVVLGGVWIKRLQGDVKTSSDKCAALATEFHQHQLAFLQFQLEHSKEYSTKIETQTARQEIMGELKKLESKIDNFQLQLNTKVDK